MSAYHAGEIQYAHSLLSQARSKKTLGHFTDRENIIHKLECLLSAQEEASDESVPYLMEESYYDDIKPGISLVTCSMNRHENLIKALLTWLPLVQICEIIIVDWSSTQPVSDLLKQHNIDDSRIKVVQVLNQKRWILSYAFNLGFRFASFDKILKVDADIQLTPDFFINNQLEEGCFIAGNWRLADSGQEYINGFFYLYYKDLMKVKGFNEFITTYGWDDDDIYHRLHLTGLRRCSVSVDTIFHLPHDDAMRVVNQEVNGAHEGSGLEQQTHFKIRTNFFISILMPSWNEDRYFWPCNILHEDCDGWVVEQAYPHIHQVPANILREARMLASREILSWRFGDSVLRLAPDKVFSLLTLKAYNSIHELDILTSTFKTDVLHESAKKLLIDIGSNEVQANLLNELAEFNACTFIVVSDKKIQERNSHILFISRNELNETSCCNMSKVPVTTDLKEYFLSPNWFVAQADYNDVVNYFTKTLKTGSDQNTLYIDAQHGLGNRLRAIGSAAAIARSEGLGFTIVWRPDHHCQCAFSDLFEYSGSVIEDSFLDRAKNEGNCYNYMEIESGAQKNKLIEPCEPNYTYCRSAFTLNHPGSYWDSENLFLKGLKVSRVVNQLIESVDVTGAVGAHTHE